MKGYVPLFISCFALLADLTTAKGCGNTCSAYRCVEKTAHCGAKGYLIGYGERYCRRFNNPANYRRFDAVGRRWVKCTTACLASYVSSYRLRHRRINCGQLLNDAFNSHVSCYLNCGFCRICKTNKAALMHIYSLKDFFNARALKTVAIVGGKCGLQCLLPG